MAAWDATTPNGLLAILENPKWPVSKACQAVEDCVLANSDNLRGFFEQCFPTLLKRLFGYDGTSWLNLVAQSTKEVDARALLRLLSPTGPLFTAMYSADADGSTQFFFPRERLPTHTQMLLASPAGRAELERWPQYPRGAVVADAAGRCHVKLGVFQFFVCWFAFYVIKGDGVPVGALDSQMRPQAAGLGSSVRKAADALHLMRGRESEAWRHPYLAVLRQFLLDLLPRPTTAAQVAGAAATPAKVGSSAFFRVPASPAKRQADGATRGSAFYSVLLEFWVTDGDEPVPLAAGAPAAPAAGAVSMWGTTYEPPSEDLLEALTELVKYATVADSGAKRQPAQGGAAWLPMAQLHTLLPPALAAQRGSAAAGGGAAPSAAAGVPAIHAGPSRLGAAAQPAAQAFARRLYRFFRRAITLWPEQRSIKPLLRCLLAYLAPWRVSGAAPMLLPGGGAAAPGHSALASHLTAQVTDLVHRVHWADGGKGDGSSSYGPQWEAHVLSNLPFYLALLPLFLEASVPRVEVRGESAAQDLVNVLGVLEGAPELRDLLQRVERELNKYASSQPRRADGAFAELLPWLLEQAQDWEVAATANFAGETPLVRATPAFSLYSTAEGGAAFLARDLLDISSHIFKPEVQRRLRQCLEASLPLAQLPAAAAEAGRGAEEARYDEAVPRLPKSSWRDVHYRGDPLLRPIASFELGLLVRLLVAVSMRLNAALGLGFDQGGERQQGRQEDEPPENRLQELLARARRRGLRVNLRPLADVRNLAWIPVLLFLCLHGLRFLAWLAVALVQGAGEAAGGPGGGGAYRAPQHHQQQHHRQHPQY